jgi:hypothetical protein
VQHQAAQYNTTPFYAHACLVPGHVPAKVARFKEHNLWAIESDAYYSHGSFLLYENTVRTFVSLLETKAGHVCLGTPCQYLTKSIERLSTATHLPIKLTNNTRWHDGWYLHSTDAMICLTASLRIALPLVPAADTTSSSSS